ncbi:hypothetical protein, partial [Limobrevibacterium gyesilva]
MPAPAGADAPQAAKVSQWRLQPLQPLPLLDSEAAARGSWVPPGARVSPWTATPAPLWAAPRKETTRIGAIPPGSQLPADVWASGAYEIQRKLDGGAWFLVATGGQAMGYVSGNDIIEVWPAPAGPAPATAKPVRQWPVAGRDATLRDAGTHYDLTVPMTCKLAFCDSIQVFTPKPPDQGAIIPTFQVPRINGAWRQDETVDVRVLLPRRIVETKGTQLVGCIGQGDGCEPQTLLSGG